VPPKIIQVAIFTGFSKLLDYIVVEETFHFENIAPGMRVQIPLGTRSVIGICTAILLQSTLAIERLKAVEAILDAAPLLPASIMQLITWVSQYYHYPLGETYAHAYPNELRKKAQSSKPRVDKKKINIKPNNFSNKNFLALNEAQAFAVASIKKALSNFQVFLLDGITGSGKTEVYMHMISYALERNTQALVLIPEIGLTPQTIARFESRFDVPIVILHSGINASVRALAWENARTGKAAIIIGTRSASFTPLKNPGIFIIDEEHDLSFKQQDGLRYSARDLLIKRASIEKVPVILGSATPSLETLHNALSKKYTHLQLPVRAGEAKPPTFTIIDVRHKKLEAGLSAQLLSRLTTHLNNNRQVLLFLNRRGFAPVLMCYGCGWVANCTRCDARLTLHFVKQQLRCHHCHANTKLPNVCPSCQAPELKPLGVGTERLEQVLKGHFENIPIIRVDRDTTTKKDAMHKVIEQIQKGGAQILLGTQMLAKGHHFPNITLAAIIDIDAALYGIDFRNLERLGQLITQIAGRAGRAEFLGEVILQTCHPEHALLNLLLKKGYYNFARQLLNEREQSQLPPFGFQALIRAESKQPAKALNFLQQIKEYLLSEKMMSLKVLGPAPAPMVKRIGYHRAQLLLESNTRASLHQGLKILRAELECHAPSSIRWSIDVDPIEML